LKDIRINRFFLRVLLAFHILNTLFLTIKIKTTMKTKDLLFSITIAITSFSTFAQAQNPGNKIE